MHAQEARRDARAEELTPDSTEPDGLAVLNGTNEDSGMPGKTGSGSRIIAGCELGQPMYSALLS